MRDTSRILVIDNTPFPPKGASGEKRVTVYLEVSSIFWVSEKYFLMNVIGKFC